MAPASDSVDEKAIEILGQVELVSLKATPGTIAPFAAAEIAWSVSGPTGFGVLLESANVPKVGSKVVTPLSTRTFRLKAKAGRLTQVLGAVTVTVDQSTCRIVPLPNREVELAVRAGIEQLLVDLPGTVRRRDDRVTVDQTGIDISLAFKQVIGSFPDAHMDIEAHWLYRAVNGQLVEHITELSASAGFPFYQRWVYLVPVLSPLAQAKLKFAEDDAKEKLRAKVADGADALEEAVPPGFRLLSAGFNPANFEMLACPDQSLRSLLVSGTAVLGQATLVARAQPVPGPT